MGILDGGPRRGTDSRLTPTRFRIRVPVGSGARRTARRGYGEGTRSRRVDMVRVVLCSFHHLDLDGVVAEVMPGGRVWVVPCSGRMTR